MKDYYIKVKELMEDIKINENIKNIVKNTFIPVDISFKYEKDEKNFELIESESKTKKLLKDNIIYKSLKKKNYISFKNY